jgi:alcohol dehydrogenase
MKAFYLRAHGGNDQYANADDWPDPKPEADQVLVQIHACGLNYLDIFVRRGMPDLPVEMPRIPGSDISGVVVDVGDDVDRSWVDQRVLIDPRLVKQRGALGEHANGGTCEYICVEEPMLIPLPDNVTFEHAAALPIAYGTAHRMMITRGQVKQGELVLILGASGGVGTGCIQLAKAAGAKVIACSSSPEKLVALQELGADYVINSSAEDFSKRAWEISGKRGVDVIINYTGGDTWVPSIRALRHQGRLLTCGATAGFDPKTDLRYIWVREANILGSNGWERRDLTELVEKVSQQKIIPTIHKTYSLENAVSAVADMEDRKIFGKVIVVPNA